MNLRYQSARSEQFTSGDKSNRYTLLKRLLGFHGRSGQFGEEEARFVDCAARGLVILLSYRGS